MHFCISMQYHQYYGLQVIHCRRLSKIQQVLLPHMVSNWGLPAPDCHFSDLQDLLTRAATTAFTTALAMSLHLGVRLAAPKHNRAYFNSIVLQLHIPPDTASTAINPPIPIYFLKKKKNCQIMCYSCRQSPVLTAQQPPMAQMTVTAEVFCSGSVSALPTAAGTRPPAAESVQYVHIQSPVLKFQQIITF